jgi:hypothetical protein
LPINGSCIPLNLKKLAHSCDTSPTRFTTISYGGSELIDQTPICAKGALFIINLGGSKIVPTNNQSKEDIK